MSYKIKYKFSDRESQIAELSARIQGTRSAIIFSELRVFVSGLPLTTNKVSLENALEIFEKEIKKFDVHFLSNQYAELKKLFEE